MYYFGLFRKLALKAALAATALLSAIEVAGAQMSPAEQRGRTFAMANCGKCHSTDKFSPSPLGLAPPLRQLHERYPIERLEEALAEGIVTGHANMPEFKLPRDQVGDLIAFLKTFER